jgi:flagellar basal-body rod modification protein FlgD
MTVSGVSGTSTTSDTSGLSTDSSTIAGNFDTFLQLLTTQLQNQNPLDPLDTNQFTQQLVEFSGVEQQLKTNDYLSSLVSVNSNTVNSSAVNYIGKTVSASGVQSDLSNGQAQWSFNLADAANVNVDIKDSSGNVVYTESGSMQGGQGTFTWDGTDSAGNNKPDGTYSIQMQATDANGKNVAITTQTSGTVTGVDFTGTEPVLLLGNTRVNLSSVASVSSVTPAS